MGSSKRRKDIFFLSHPACCFCGGESLATTQDHFPSRSIFNGRRWPNRFVFPACGPCQTISVRDEVLVKLLARSTAEPLPNDDKNAFERDMRAMFWGAYKTFPDVFKSLALTTNEKRRAVKKNQIAMRAGDTFAELPLISLRHPLIQSAVKIFAQKLFSALFYLHTGKILPTNSSIIFHWHTNAQPHVIATLERELLQRMPDSAQLLSGNTNIEGQFRYNHAVPDGHDFAGFIVTFHNSFTMLGVVFPDRIVDQTEGVQVLHPLSYGKS